MTGQDPGLIPLTRPSRKVSRELLLAKGVELFDTVGRLVPVAEVTAMFSNERGKPRTSGWAYQNWPNQQAYWDDVAFEVADRPWFDDSGGFRVDRVLGCLNLPWKSDPVVAARIHEHVQDAEERFAVAQLGGDLWRAVALIGEGVVSLSGRAVEVDDPDDPTLDEWVTKANLMEEGL
jgi:hypothetical protein